MGACVINDAINYEKVSRRRLSGKEADTRMAGVKGLVWLRGVMRPVGVRVKLGVQGIGWVGDAPRPLIPMIN